MTKGTHEERRVRIPFPVMEALYRPIAPSQFLSSHPYRVEGQRWKLDQRWIEEPRIVHCSSLELAARVAQMTGMEVV